MSLEKESSELVLKFQEELHKIGTVIAAQASYISLFMEHHQRITVLLESNPEFILSHLTDFETNLVALRKIYDFGVPTYKTEVLEKTD